MRTSIYSSLFLFFSFFSSSSTVVALSIVSRRSVDAATSRLHSRGLVFAYGPAPPPEEGPPLSFNAIRNPAYLPAQIGGIVGAYALSLVFVAITLLLLAKRRRDHLEAGEDPDYLDEVPNSFPETLQLQDHHVPYNLKSPAHTNFSYPQSPTGKSYFSGHSVTSSSRVLGIDPSVDQTIVQADHEMAQTQLEEMYKYVMEQEAAKEAGVVLQEPPAAISPDMRAQRQPPHHNKMASTSSTSMLLRGHKSKPSSLNLNNSNNSNVNVNINGGSNDSPKDERSTHSRTSSIFSVLKSPRRKKMQGMNISSPIMTPMSGTFPRYNTDAPPDIGSIPPRHYLPTLPPPPPVPKSESGSANMDSASTLGRPSDDHAEHSSAEHSTDHSEQEDHHNNGQKVPGAPLTPDMSPQSTASIDERLGATVMKTSKGGESKHRRNESTMTAMTVTTAATATEGGNGADPVSAVSQESQIPLVGLPSSPKPNVTRFPASIRSGAASLPASPRSSTFARSNAPSAVRTGGALPLRAYEQPLASPSHQTTKQTVFERTTPLSPGGKNGVQTPWTGAPVPYTPYQPFSPVVPVTPSLVTKADRKRMRRLEPKTPTMEMVKSIDEIW